MDESEVVSRVLVEAHQQLAWTYYDLGAYEKGLDHCQRAISYHDNIEPTARIAAFTILGLLYLDLGAFDEADQAVAQGREHFDLNGMVFPEWWESLSIQLTAAELAFALGRPNQAESLINHLE